MRGKSHPHYVFQYEWNVEHPSEEPEIAPVQRRRKKTNNR